MKKPLAVFFCLSLLASPALTKAGMSLSATCDPPLATLGAALSISATLDEEAANDSQIKITLPNDMRVPESIGDGLVTVNGLPAKGLAVEGHQISFVLPEPQENRKDLAIVFPISAGLKNPFKGGSYPILVDVGEFASRCQLEVQKILKQAPKVSVKPDKVGKSIGVTIQIPHPSGLVVNQDDRINLTFPTEFIFPKDMDPEEVFVCGNKPPAIISDNGMMTLIVAKDIPESEPITIVINPGFGIKSPLWPGNFSILVGIPGKMEDTQSETFQIFALSPTLSLVIDPPMPESGWYPSIPTIQIVSSAKREIHYSWDSQPRQTYSEAFQPESGIHVLSYVGRVENGGWESELFETFRVDLDEPVIEPVRGSVNTEQFTLTYSVKDTSLCVSGVGDTQAKQTSFNTFEIELQLEPGENNFVFWAEDIVGRRVEIPHKIVLDKTPPALTVISPAQSSVVCGKEVTVTGKTEPGATLKVNGNVVVPNSKGDFTGVVKPNEEGPIDIIVEATDPAGNTTAETVPILYIKSSRIVLKIGSRQVTIAGKTKEIEVAPYEKFGTAFIPLPTVAGWLGYKLTTTDKKSWLMTDKQGTKVKFSIDSNVVNVDTKQGSYTRTLENNPEMTDGTVCVPVEFIDRALGLETMVDTDTVTILFCPKS